MAIQLIQKPTNLLGWLILLGKILAVIVVAVLLSVLAISQRANIGKIIRWIWGNKPETYTPKVTDSQGNLVGEAVKIVLDPNPFRDKSVIKLENGKVIQLPKGVIDKDIDKVIIDKAGVYNVQTIGRKSTDIFDDVDSKSDK